MRDKSKEELIKYARDRLGLNLTMAMTRAEMLSKITEAENALTPDETFRKKGYVKIQIRETSEPGGNEPVYIAVNETSALIPRMTPVWLRPHLVAALQSRRSERGQQLPDGTIQYRTIQHYPCDVLDGADNLEEYLRKGDKFYEERDPDYLKRVFRRDVSGAMSKSAA